VAGDGAGTVVVCGAGAAGPLFLQPTANNKISSEAQISCQWQSRLALIGIPCSISDFVFTIAAFTSLGWEQRDRPLSL